MEIIVGDMKKPRSRICAFLDTGKNVLQNPVAS